jgi:hypothetical protein
MSVHAVKAVWDYSQHTGSALLMLLAVADHANADGMCWPSIPRLADMVRVSERQAKRLIADLVESGELAIKQGGGRGNTNVYCVTLVARHDARQIRGPRNGDMRDTVSQKNGDMDDTLSFNKKVTSRVEKVTSRVRKGDIAMSPEPSGTIKNRKEEEPPTSPATSSAGAAGQEQEEEEVPAQQRVAAQKPKRNQNGTHPQESDPSGQATGAPHPSSAAPSPQADPALIKALRQRRLYPEDTIAQVAAEAGADREQVLRAVKQHLTDTGNNRKLASWRLQRGDFWPEGSVPTEAADVTASGPDPGNRPPAPTRPPVGGQGKTQVDRNFDTLRQLGMLE